MRVQRSSLFVAVAGLAWLLLSPPLRLRQAMAAQSSETGAPPSGCRLSGPHRRNFLRSGLDAQLRGMTASSELTTKVAAAIARPTIPRSRSRASQRFTSPPASDTIDGFIFEKLQEQKITAAPPTTDSEFLRRVTLDLTGRIPTQEEVVQFLNDADPNKRGRKIDSLLASPQWSDRWAMFFGDLYHNTILTAQVNRFADGRDAFHLFIRQSLRANKPYDQMVREILSASGSADGRTYPDEYANYQHYQQVTADYVGNPVKQTAASYIVGGLTTGGPAQDTYDALAASVARDFLGISHMDCILCHNGAGHLDSLSVWGATAKRAQGWGLASFFAQTRLARPRNIPPPPDGTQAQRPRYWVVSNDARGEYRLNTTTGNRPTRAPAEGAPVVAAAVYPFGGGSAGANESRREALGRLLIADRQFARATVNYIWREFFARGIVEPADQFDPARLDPANPPPDPWTIQPSHPELLEFLTSQVIEHRFDLKWLMRAIANSEAYQLSSRYEGQWNPTYEAFFARHQVRRLKAEELLDAVLISGGLPVDYVVSQAIGDVQFAMQFPDVQLIPRTARTGGNGMARAAGAFLDAFFRGDRDETPRSGESSILQALQLMNSSVVAARVDAGNPDTALTQILAQPDEALVQILYLRVLSRPPVAEELAAGVQTLRGGDRGKKAEDLMWSLYNKIDFIFNY